MNQEQQTLKDNDSQQDWGRMFLLFQGMIALLEVCLVSFNFTPIAPVAEVVWISILGSLIFGVAWLIKNRKAKSENVDPRWWLLPVIMVVEAIVIGILVPLHWQAYSFFLPFLLVPSFLAVRKAMANWQWLVLAGFTGMLVGAVNTVANPAVGMVTLLAIGSQLIAFAEACRSRLFTSKQMVVSLILTAISSAATIAVVVVTLLHIH